MKMRQELKAMKFWDSSRIQNIMPANIAVSFVDDRTTVKFEQTKLGQEVLAIKLWDSSKIQNEKPTRIAGLLYLADDKDEFDLEQMRLGQALAMRMG
jgi:hypothetical protein